MRCVFCGGRTEEKTVTFTCERNGRSLLVKNVPAYVCVACGEETYSPEVTDELLHLAKRELEPIEKTLDFAKARA